MVGRDREFARLRRLLDEARAGTTCTIVVEGEAGIGKTVLLQALADGADGFSVVRATGVESEAAWGHAALLELLTPLRVHLDTVPVAQAEALGAALGWGAPRPSGGRFLVAAGTLSLLAAASSAKPVLVIVDDAQWLDHESVEALHFALRRLHHDRVAFVLARRPDTAPSLDDVPRLVLAGLSAAAATTLLDSDVAPSVVAELVQRVGGNPLALAATNRQLSRAQRRGAARLPDPLPIGEHLHRIHESRLASLSGLGQQLVVLAAAGDSPVGVVTRALGASDDDSAAAFDELALADIAHVEGGRLRFAHPLLRSTALGSAATAQLRWAHRALADAVGSHDETSRAWHLAEAAAGPDDEVADALAAVAGRAQERQGFAAASTMLERAAALSTDAHRAGGHLAGAVRDAFLGGDLDRVRALARRALAGPSRGPDRALVLHTLGLVEQYAGSVPAAAPLLSDAAELADGRLRAWSLTELAMTQYRLGALGDMRDTAGRLAAVGDLDDPEQQLLADFTTGVAELVVGEVARGRRHLVRAATLLDTDPHLRDDPRVLSQAILVAGLLGPDITTAPRFERRLQIARERGALGILVTALAMWSYANVLRGDHDGAYGVAGEAAELAHHLGFVADAAPAVEMLAWQSASRGLHTQAQEALATARELVVRAGTETVAAHLALTDAYCALCRGDLEGIVDLLEARLDVDDGRGAMGEPLGVAPPLIEAYAGLRRIEDAVTLTERYVAANPNPKPAHAALAARCRALTATDDDAMASFEAALAAHADALDTFEMERTRLLLGTRLRRASRRIDARKHLRHARDQFDAWGLTHWTNLATHELRATGETARPRRPMPTEPLTSQETRIANLVAQGLSNREVAAALFLSPKTVEYHLTSVYRKRGWRSRTELTRDLAPTIQGRSSAGGSTSR